MKLLVDNTLSDGACRAPAQGGLRSTSKRSLILFRGEGSRKPEALAVLMR